MRSLWANWSHAVDVDGAPVNHTARLRDVPIRMGDAVWQADRFAPARWGLEKSVVDLAPTERKSSVDQKNPSSSRAASDIRSGDQGGDMTSLTFAFVIPSSFSSAPAAFL